MKTVVHFGAGALGRGLVVPMLHQSGYRVYLADTNMDLITDIKKKRSYLLDISDDTKQRLHRIPIEDIVTPISQEAILIRYLQESDIVTTAVRRENLIHVAKVIAKAWGNEESEHKIIICCENIEGVGKYFKALLKQCATPEQFEHLNKLRIPDTIVDRICATGASLNEVTSEAFHECSVDKTIVEDTGIAYIPSIEHIQSHFYRKRYLLNTYADAMAFLALSKNHTYLYEAMHDEDLQTQLQPYMELLMKLLECKYGIPHKESEAWLQLYRQRLSNPKIPRYLHTVARNLWVKMSLSERFVCPLIDLMKLGVDVSEGVALLYHIIDIGNTDVPQSQVDKEVEKLWSVNECGSKLFKLYEMYSKNRNIHMG